MTEPAALTVDRVDVDDVEPHPDNPRVGDVERIAESLTENGQYRPIVVQQSTRQILAGNHTWKAARQLGWTHVDVTFVDVDDDRARRILLADNRTADLATYEDEQLADLLTALAEDEAASFAGTGFTAADLDELMYALGRQVPDFEPEDDDEQPRLDQRDPIECPECGHTWRVGPRGETEPV